MIPWRMEPSLARCPTHGKPEKLLEECDLRRLSHYSIRTDAPLLRVDRALHRFDSVAPAHSASRATRLTSLWPSPSALYKRISKQEIGGM